MIGRALAFLLGILPLLAGPPDPGPSKALNRLPGWAAEVALASLAEPAPADAEAWVLLQKSEFLYGGGGEMRIHSRRLVRILEERGLAAGGFTLGSLGGGASRIRALKGWNLRPDGDLVRLERRFVATLGGGVVDAGDSIQDVTVASLERVIKGSLVAFESEEEVKLPMGPNWMATVLDRYPTRQWELSLSGTDGVLGGLLHGAFPLRLECRNLGPWTQGARSTPTALQLGPLPARPRDEGLAPWPLNAEPIVFLTFLDPGNTGAPSMADWDAYAEWVDRAYAARRTPVEPVPLRGKGLGESMEALREWMSRELAYRQVYLTAERGWAPETSAEVCRRHYGDCKDLTSCFNGALMALDVRTHPVLAAIHTGEIPPDAPVSPWLFNHVISAVELKGSLGLAAEVDTPKGRFLLVDPTSRLTPLGLLPEAHRGRRVMICTESGAVWVQVPDAAIQASSLEVRLQGALGPGGNLEAVVLLEEEGNAEGLRSLALQATAKVLQKRLVGLLRLHEDARLELLDTSDPLDLRHPLELHVRLQCPRALTSAGGEWRLEPVGLPEPPPSAQKPGHLRQFPLESLRHGRWALRFDLELPPGFAPRFREQSLTTPFRSAEGKVALDGRTCHGEFASEAREARFSFAQREDGVKEARRDRSQLKALEEGFLTFTRP